MALKLSDLVITTDIDGTLLNAPDPIPERNIEAVCRFTQNGGRFAVASGRSIESSRQYVNLLPVNAPCIVFNGSGIYDYQSEELLYASYLPDTFRTYLKQILLEFPDIGALALNQQKMYCLSGMHFVEKYLGVERQPFFPGEIELLRGDFFKLIFSMEEDTLPQIQEFVASRDWNDVSFTRSGPNFLEMLPLGVNKGSGLLHLADCMGISIDQTVSIGNYYNDFQMLQTSALGVAVLDAPEDIKEICSLVVGDCTNGAIADLIEYLEETFPLT